MAKKPGKYAGVIKGLEVLPVENQSYQDKINKIKAGIVAETVHTAESLAKEYRILRTAKEDLKDQLEIIQEQLTAIEQLVVESHDRDETGWGLYGAGDNTIKLPDGASLSVQLEPTGKVEDKEAFRQWCIANGLETALQLWPSTMNSIVKERLLNGEKEPDGVKAYLQTKLVWRGGD